MGDVFLKLLNMSITAGWLILAVLCVRLLFRKIPKWVNCVLWGVGAIRLIFPFSIESEFSLQPSAEPIKSTTMIEGELLPYVPSVDSNLAIVENTVNPILAETFAYQETESTAPLQVITELAGSVWFCGMLVLFAFAIGSMVRLRFCVREAVRYRGNVYLCDAVKSPFILGIIKPRIYLSSAVWEDEMDYIIAHERAHLRRKDHLWKPLGYFLLCIYWFNPLCWIAYIMLCKDIELACDEKVIRDMSFDDKKKYSRVLLSCATQKRMVFVCPLAFGEVGVKERVRTVLHYRKPAFWITLVAMVICVVVAVCFLTNPQKEYSIRITIPAGSTEEIVYQEDFFYSDEEISPIGNKITISLDEGMGDTEVVLKPIEIKEENAYEPTYITPGMPVEMDVEQGAWFKIGVNMQNFTSEDKIVYVSVENVEVRIASEGEEKNTQKGGADADVQGENIDNAALSKADGNSNMQDVAVQDLSYYLELSAVDISFQEMSEKRQAEILAEYDTLLDDYILMARESTDGQTAYIVGHYQGDITSSPLYRMKDMGYTVDKQRYQLLYLEENYEAMDRIKDEKGVSAITDEAYVLEHSNITWTADRASILIQPVDSGLKFYDTFGFYHNPARGREYIEDALSRGIAFNTVAEPYLSVYMISEKYGEITERISLTEQEAAEILSEDKQKLTEGHGFVASLNINGESMFYSEFKGIPQTVIDLAVEKCGYQFASPADITSPIKEARFDCSWLKESLYLEETYLPRLEEILKSAKFDGMGNCGYGAKLTLTLENGETLTVFKGTDDCGSLVFGSYGGYSISDEADDEFWEMFGLSADGEKRLELREQKVDISEVSTSPNPVENPLVVTFEFTEPVNTLANVTMRMEKYKSTEGDLEIVNHSGKELTTGAKFDIQMKVDGKWYCLDQVYDAVWNLIAYKLPDGDTTILSTNWSFMYGELPPGSYRIIKEVTDYRAPGDYDTYYLGTEFEIE